MGSYQRQGAPADGDLFQPSVWPVMPQDLDEMLGRDIGTERPQGAQQSVLMAQALAMDIIPRLVMAHRALSPSDLPFERSLSRITSEDVALFTELIRRDDEAAVRDWVLALRSLGVEVEVIFTELLAPAARHLGQMWERDLCDFSEVTMGMGRLQRVMREQSLSACSPPERHSAAANRSRLLLVQVPGEQHTFGLSMVGEIFHRAGWEVESHFAPDRPLATVMRESWFDVVGISLSSPHTVAPANALIEQVRSTSQNPLVSIIAGGSVFEQHPQAADELKADGVITDVVMAPDAAQRLLTARSGLA